MAPHPFDAISPGEMQLASKLIKDTYSSEKPHFVQMDRVDPPKKDMLIYLEAEKKGYKLPAIPRIVQAYYYIGVELKKALVNVSFGHVITIADTPKGTVGPILPEDMIALEDLAMEHPIVKAEIAKLQLPDNIVVRSDPWIYGTDDDNEDRFLVQFFMYLADATHSESNHYSLPLKFCPVFEALTQEFIRIDYLPSGVDSTVTATMKWEPKPIIEYHPDLNGESLRDIKPLLVSQPEGPSFEIDGSKVKWQGWEFVVAPNVREGFAIYDVSFKGRSIMYRLALSEMTVPYGDPRAPFHRKQAFDLGDCGFGTNGNHLSLGCDCLGVIKYKDCYRCNGDGEPVLMPNTVCMHEQDYGLLYKHVNYRTNGAVVARRREFVVQTIATVANYEYIVNIVFDQAGQISIQVRATGILSTTPLDDDSEVPSFATRVGPGVMAPFHQHMLSFRIDPAIDGHSNSVAYDDVLQMAPHTKENPHSVGFYSQRTFVEKSGSIAQNPWTNRAYKIVNENVINPTTKKPVAYKVALPARNMILGHPDSFTYKRAHFATEQIWVTKYRDNQLYASGEFTNQSHVDTGLKEWANGDDSVRNEDIVVWATLGFTHVPRSEDFPVMPVEIHQIDLVPYGFFEHNPALDIPQANNRFNKSVLVKDGQAGSCCSKSAL
ncbi:unnamed protein product [Kuraishia capsulata CBS 1993]|uniref:Amine oxidase n=1 Tax=Kuraishia capsulata CBS 1993 TaxID=1382522 RepID=W6ML76_9ASCO|nr:uncharacterized protein KUCA_T00003194001 [Kuraishia capsulata CBS 1993]CDK27216.1 unnamed protein product [Kuraishia capsulata CBS 1993]